MELRHLRYFQAVARAGSISQAAAELRITQPPLSAAMKQLESDLAARLLTRTSQGVTLTPSGEEVLQYADQILGLEADLRRRVTSLESGLIGSLIIFCSPTLMSSHLPPMLRRLTRSGTGIDVTLREGNPLACVEAVQAKQADVALVATAASDDLVTLFSDLEVECIDELDMVVALPPGAFPDPSPLRLDQLTEYEFAIPEVSMRNGLRVALLHAFTRAGLLAPMIREVPSMHESIPLVSAGQVIAVIPASFESLIHPDRVDLRPLVDGPDPLEVSIVYRRERRRSPVVERFRRIAHEIVPESSART